MADGTAAASTGHDGSALGPKPTIFLIPGGWHGAWCFETVCAELALQGYSASSRDLVSVGAHVEPTIGLYDDAAAMREVLERLIITEEKEVLVVGHSYGGFVAMNAVQDLSYKQRQARGKEGGVTMLVFLASYPVSKGLSIVDAFGGKIPEWWNTASKSGFSLPKQDDSLNLLYNDMDPEEAAVAIGKMQYQSLQTTQEQSEHEPWAEGFNLGYLFTKKDEAASIAVQQALVGQFPPGTFAWTESIDTGHSPFVSQPKALAQLLADAAEASVKVCKYL